MKFTKEFIYTKVKENDFDFFTDFIEADSNLEEVEIIQEPERGIKYNESNLILHFSLLDIYVLVKGEYDHYYDLDWVSVSLVKPKYYEKLIKEIEYEEITLEEIEQENERGKKIIEDKETTILNKVEETNIPGNEIAKPNPLSIPIPYSNYTKLLKELDFELNQADYCYWEFNEPQNLSELFNPKLDSNQRGMQKYLESLIKDNEITLRELHLINTLWEIRKELLEQNQD